MDLPHESLLNFDSIQLMQLQGCHHDPAKLDITLFDIVTRVLYLRISNMVKLYILRAVNKRYSGMPKFDIVSHVSCSQHTSPLSLILRKRITKFLRVGLNLFDELQSDVYYKDYSLHYVLLRLGIGPCSEFCVIKGFNMESRRRVAFRMQNNVTMIKATHGHILRGLTTTRDCFKLVKGYALHYSYLRNVEFILKEGIRCMNRSNVHLTMDETPPKRSHEVAFVVDIGELSAHTQVYVNSNGVCLVRQGDTVPPSAILSCVEVSSGNCLWPAMGYGTVMFSYVQQREIRENALKATCASILCTDSVVPVHEPSDDDLELQLRLPTVEESICCLSLAQPCAVCLATLI